MASIGEKLKELRAREHLTQQELADKLCISRSRLNNYEQGIREPDFDTLFSLSEFFNVDLDFFAGRLLPLEPLDEEVETLNSLLYDLGEHIIKVNGEFFLGECGTISEDDIAFIRSSAVSGARMAFDVLKKRARKELRDAISGK